MRQTHKLSRLIILCGLLTMVNVGAFSQSSGGSFKIANSVVAGGGCGPNGSGGCSPSSGGNLSLNGTVAEPGAADLWSEIPYSFRSGFWNMSFGNSKANQTITFATLADRTFGDSDFTVSATSDSGLTLSFSAKGNCTVNGSTVHLTGAGSCTITASQTGDSNYNPATDAPQSFNIAKSNQTITFGALASKTFGDADFTLSGTASSGLGVSFVPSGQCTVSGSTVHITGAGSCTITASQTGDSNYNPAADVPQILNINKANQTITFGALANKTLADPDFTVSAKSDSGLSVSFSATGNCTVSGNTVHITAAGSCTIAASQTGDSNYNPATDVPQTLNIRKANQTITFGAPANKTFGDPDFTVSATSDSGLGVSFSATGNCTVSSNRVHITGAGSCTITASQAGDSNYTAATDAPQSFNIAKSNQTITFAALANKTFGAADFSVSATASSSLSVGFTATGQCSLNGATVHITSAGSCTIIASQGGDSNYNPAADVPQTLNISKANQTITFGALANKTLADPDFTVSAKSDSGLSVSFSATGNCTVSGNTVHITGAGSCTITASQAGDSSYDAATSVPQSFTVAAPTTTTYAEPWGNCGAGNTPCFTAIQAAIDTLTSGGTVNVLGGTFNENVNLSTNVTVNINSDTTINSLTMSAGTLNGSNGGSFTLALATGDWTNNGGAFNAGSGTVSFSGSGQTIGGTNPTTFNNLTTGSGGATMNGIPAPVGNSVAAGNHAEAIMLDETVTGVLALNGDLTVLGPAKLIMTASASSTGTGDVVGNLLRTGFVTGSCANAPCANTLSLGNPNNQLTFTGGTAPTSIMVKLEKASPATYTSAVQRNYTITETGGSGFTATLRLHYLDSELNGNTEANLSLRRLTDIWNTVTPSAVDTANNWVECNAVTGFSQWALAALAPTSTPGTISGRILNDSGLPVEGAVVRLSGTQTRKTITDANGNYRFSNVEANGFYTVTPARVNYNFSPFNRSFSQLGSQTEAVFGASFTGDTANPLDTPEYFVRQQYVDVLGREPDEVGFNFWSDRILACLNDADCLRSQRIAVAAEFFIHQEFQQSGAFIYNLYQGSLGRRPQYAEYASDRRQVVGGPNLEAEKQAFAESFVGRSEFMQKYEASSTAEGFVDALLLNLRQTTGVDLGGQRDGLIARYNRGVNQTQSRTFALRDVTENHATVGANYNSAFVLTEYFGYLRRDADRGGYNFWLNVLNEIGRNGDPGNYNRMVCSFITSTEYQKRFSAVISHGNGECGQ